MIFESNKPVKVATFDAEPESILYGLSRQISVSAKKVLLQEIEFKEAMFPDHEQENVFKKYKPINHGFGMLNSSSNSKLVKLPTSNTGSRQSNGSNDDVGDDVPQPKVVLFPHDGIQLEWKGFRRIGPGLSNQGNTCFLNSVLQVLTHTAPLFNFLLTTSHKEECLVVGHCMLCELKNHVVRISRHNPQQGAIRPMSIIQRLSCIGKQFKFGRQEDSHEFLRYVIEGLQKSCLHGKAKLDRYSKETTAIHRVFGGYYRSQVECLRCHHKSNTYDPMLDLNLDIKEVSSVVAALRKHIQPERLDGENRYQCDKCRTKTVAHKRGAVHQPPNVLTLQLKRFDYQKSFGGKISKDVQFSETLDVRPFMASKGPPIMYHLYAVLVHSGYSCNSGHYYCYVKGPNGLWYEMNDSQVSQVGLGRVLKAQAYLLFYIKATPAQASSAAPRPSHPQRQDAKPNATAKSTPTTPVAAKSQHNVIKPSAASSTPRFSPTIIGASTKSLLSGLVKTTSQIGVPVVRKQNGTAKPCSSAGISTASAPAASNSNTPPSQPTAAVVAGGGGGSLDRLKSYQSDSDEEIPATKATPTATTRPMPNSERVQTPDDSVDSKRNETTDEETSAKTNARLKLKLTVQTPSRHDNFKVWTPTKPSFVPRCVFQRATKSTDISPAEKQDGNETNAVAKQSSSLSPCLPLPSNSVMYGPMLPPPRSKTETTHQRERTSSITSETNSACSVSSTTGDWVVYDKGLRHEKKSRLKERQHAGWQVESMSPGDKETESETSRLLLSENGGKKKSKKEKKRRKKRRHSSSEEKEELRGDKVEGEVHANKKRKKRRHSSSEEKEELRGDKVEREEHAKKSSHHKLKKKKKKKTKRQMSDEEELLSPVKRKRSEEEEDDQHHGKEANSILDSTVVESPHRKTEERTEAEGKVSSSSAVVHQWDAPRSQGGVTWDGTCASAQNPLLESLTAGSSCGYGNKVLSWNGDRSRVDAADTTDAQTADAGDANKEWDDFYDEGKVKKTKHSHPIDPHERHRVNEFQRTQDRKNYYSSGDKRGGGIHFKVDSRRGFASKGGGYSRF